MIPYLVMEGITRYYRQSGVLANDSVNFSLKKGEIHALAGENGAGKTTLMKILYGLEKKDEGKITINGKEADIRNPLDAKKYGIGMVRQHFRLIPEFTVAENCVLGIEPQKKGFLFDRKRAEEFTAKVIRENGFDISAGSLVKDLPVGMQQQAAIIRMLYRNDDLLILDEPTSVLTRSQTEALFSILRKLAEKGKTVILITHKLGEIKEIADRVTIMRKGRTEGTYYTRDINEGEISRIMVGYNVSNSLSRIHHPEPGRTVLSLEDVSLYRRNLQRPLLEGINLEVRSGEIIGIAGISGNGAAELEDVVSGLVSPSGGSVKLNGRDVTRLGSAERRMMGFSYVPSDRLTRGTCPDASVMDNLTAVHRSKLFRHGIYLRKKALEFGKELIARFSIDADLNAAVKTLSGGNVQKVVLSRELSADSDFIMFSQPFWGLDVASESYVRRKITECSEKGKGVLLLSSNLDEILGLSTKIAVICQGRITGLFDNDGSLTKELIGDYMLGIRSDV